MSRCDWANTDPLMAAYHDTEWGVPLFKDRTLFEFLVLDAFQAGLSWRIVLQKRERFRKAFDRFDPLKIAIYRRAKLTALMRDAGIIRNRLKIESTVDNAKAFLRAQQDFGRFSTYIWSFVGGAPIQHVIRSMQTMPATSPESNAMSLDLKQRGFRFVGSTICYAFMQATGMVNDHLVSCRRYREIRR